MRLSISYSGEYADVLGLSYDMFNAISSQFYVNGENIPFKIWYLMIRKCLKMEDIKDARYEAEGSINISIDKKSYIESKFSSGLLGFSIMINGFAYKFCEDYNINPEEYFESLIFAHDEFQKNGDISKYVVYNETKEI